MKAARRIRATALVAVACMVVVAGWTAGAPPAQAASGQSLDLRILLIGRPDGDPVTKAWEAQLTSEGVAYTEVFAQGTPGAETLSLPSLVDPGDANHGLYDGVVFVPSGEDFAWPWTPLVPVWSYEAEFHVRQINGYVYPNPTLNGLNPISSGDQSGTTPTLTAAGLAAFPALRGPVPLDTGTYGYPSAVSPAPGDSVTPLLEDAHGNVLMAVDQHRQPDWDTGQSGVSELSITFDYGPSFLQWLVLAPGLIDWVTKGAHLGLSRNYFGQNVDDTFLADNVWSTQYHCTPAAMSPPDTTCPANVLSDPSTWPADQQMSAADVTHVVEWEKQTGITLEMAFNGQGASAPDDQAYVAAMLAHKSDFDWVNHTWSHLFLGCTNFSQMPLTSVAAGTYAGVLTGGTYNYEITAATAYGESETSVPASAVVGDNGSVDLTWPDATNGNGPTLWQLESEFTGGSGFWGYHVYRQISDGSFGLVGTVAEDPTGSTSTYQFTDTGATSPGAGPSSTAAYPTATNPGILCANTAGWTAAAAIKAEINQNIAFAQTNGLPNFDPSTLVTGEHSGVENPNMPAALAGAGITTFRTDASRQPAQYSLRAASSAPSYPSNIYYNAANWPQEVDEYNTLYLAGAPNGHCVNNSTNTCITSPATEQSVLASETTIELRHLLGNDPRVGYAHQTNLIGPDTQTVGGVTSDYGYTLLHFLDQVKSQYDSLFTVPMTPVTDSSEARTLHLQSAWAAALATGDVSATDNGSGTITVTNSTAGTVEVPVSAPVGSTTGGNPFGTHVGLTDSDWVTLSAGATATIDYSATDPAVTSAPAATAQVGSALAFTVTSTGSTVPTLTATGDIPSGVTFTDNGDGTASLAGTPASGTAGDHAISVTATDGAGSTTQAFTLHVEAPPTFTSLPSTSGQTGVPFSYSVTTTGSPVASLSEDGALPAGVTFTDNGDGTATLAGTPTASGVFALTLAAHNGAGADATQSFSLTILQTPTVSWSAPAPIAYGTALSATQLDATASVPGTFAYTPDIGAVLGAGSQTLSVTFTPTDTTDYGAASATVPLTVTQGTPSVTWANPAAITYGTALSGTQLDATASVPGTFAYTPAAGTVLTAGSQNLSVTFTPTDTIDYSPVTTTVPLTVDQASPTVTWANPAAITYGTALSATQLDATASVPGTFAYSPAAGTVLTAGSQTLSVTFTPTDTTDYSPVTATVPLTVDQATPTVTWANPAPISYGTALSATQLDATSPVPGTFAYSPSAGTVLTPGSQNLSVTFTPTDTTDYSPVSTTVPLSVTKGTPTVTWANPAAITFGTALSATQLDASSPVPGTFAYSPAAGTVLTVGSHTLSVTFTPTDTTDYSPVSTTVPLTVTKGIPSVTWANPAAITYGTALSSTQLDAKSPVAGSFAYSPSIGAVLTAGLQTLSVTFTPTDSTDYVPVTATVHLTVSQVKPHITWTKPAAITYGTALSSTQLNAKVTSPPGTFTYSPPAGTQLSVGTHTLSATFTPTDAIDYATVSMTTTLTVSATVTSSAVAFTSPLSFANQSAADFVVTVRPLSGSLAPSGYVIIETGTVVLCTSPLDSGGVGRCTLAAGKLAVGTHRITAVYTPNPGFKGSKTGGTDTLSITP